MEETRSVIAEVLHWPDNIGVVFRPIRLHGQPDLLAVFIRGVADEDLVLRYVMEPLGRSGVTEAAGLSPGTLESLLTAPRVRTANRLPLAISAILEGATALFLDGSTEAVLAETGRSLPQAGENGVSAGLHEEMFVPDLEENVSLIRKRLRDPDLLAQPQHLAPKRAARAALLYLKGRAAPEVVRRVAEWMQRRAEEEPLRLGLAAGVSGKFGLLPDLMAIPWPDKAATLLDSGYVIALVDRLPCAYAAPVTAPALLYGPGDEALRRPSTGMLRLLRLFLVGLT